MAANQIDPDLPVKLQGEAGGNLNRLLAGFAEYRMDRLNIPESVEKNIAKYIAHSDLIQNFLDENCAFYEEGKRSASDLYRSFLRCLHVNGVKQLSAPIFKQEVASALASSRSGVAKTISGPGQTSPPIVAAAAVVYLVYPFSLTFQNEKEIEKTRIKNTHPTLLDIFPFNQMKVMTKNSGASLFKEPTK